MDSKSVIGGLSNNSKRSVQEFGDITIENNAIYYDKTALQISNISRTWIGKFDKKPFSMWTIIGIVIALCLFMTGIGILIFVGILFGLSSAFFIYNYISDRSDKFGLQVEMDSGFTAIFASYDEHFLVKFQNAITHDFIDRTGTTTINLDKKTIIGNQGVISYGDNASNTITRG